MKETIHQISDFIYVSRVAGKYKSKKEIVKHHIRYISKSATYTLGSKEQILKNVDIYNKRVDSRVLLKFHMAIPRCEKYEAINWTKRVKEFVKEQLNLKDEYIYLALHYNENNPHIHIALTPINNEGKALRIDKKKLREFHQNWKELLKQNNYITKKYENSVYFDRRVEYDDELRKEMKQLREVQAQIYELSKISSLPSPEKPLPEPPKEPKPSISSPSYSQLERLLDLKKQEEMDMKISVSIEADRKPYPTTFELKEVRTLRELKDIIKNRFYSNIIWQDGYRSSKNAVAISNFIVFDVDGTDRIERVEKILRDRNIKALITTTKSHSENSHHFRIVIKTNKELQESELQYYKHFMKIVADELDINVDNAAFDLARMYAPNPNSTFLFIDGKELQVDGYLEKAKDVALKEIAEREYKAYKLYQPSQQQQHWISVDVSKLLQIDIEQLIEHFERVEKRWKEGSQIYLRTKNNKYGINKSYNVAYNFYTNEGYGVISYLQEQLQTTHLLNIAKYLEDTHLANDLIVVNDEIFSEKLNRCIDNSHDFEDFIENIKREFNVKSAFINFEKQTVKIGQFTVKLNQDELDEIVDLYNRNRGPRGPGL